MKRQQTKKTKHENDVNHNEHSKYTKLIQNKH